MHNLLFKSKHSKEAIQLKIKENQHLDVFRIVLKGPNLNKEHVAQNPDTMKMALYNMLNNHLGRPKPSY